MEISHDLVILVPVFNDNESLNRLVSEIAALPKALSRTIHLVIVDDGSTQPIEVVPTMGLSIEILSLVRNVGHQRAIAIGLSHIVHKRKCNQVLVMDSDGEDQPGDISKLLSASTGSIVFASRKKRREGFVFKGFYGLYKLIFKLLTGTSISFGNFCLMPFEYAKKLIYLSEIWIHFPGAVIKSKLPYKLIASEKGKRYAGKSKMNFQSLILHGLSSLSVHIETVAVRLLIASMTLLMVSVAFIMAVVSIKVFTELALPGWTSNMLIGLTLIFLQALLFSVLLTFIILSYRTQKGFIPAIDYTIFIEQGTQVQ